MTDRDPPRVLVVDDEPDVRFVLGLVLPKAGLEIVGEAENGRRGVELAVQLQPDVIVLDLMMPVLSGREALPLLADCCPQAMIVVFSASVSANRREVQDGGPAFSWYDKAEMARLPSMLLEDYRRFMERAR